MRSIEDIKHDIARSKKEVDFYTNKLATWKRNLSVYEKDLKEATTVKAEHGDVFTHCDHTYLVVEKNGRLYTPSQFFDDGLDNTHSIQDNYDSGVWEFQYNVFKPDKKKVDRTC